SRLVDERYREGELLAPAERKAADRCVRDARETEALEHPRGAFADLLASEAVNAAVEADVLARRQVLVEREPLAHITDAALHLFGLAHDVVSGDARASARRLQQP